MARRIADTEEGIGLSDTQIEVLAITACRENHLSGERMCAQCFAIERAILKALKLQGEIIDIQSKEVRSGIQTP